MTDGVSPLAHLAQRMKDIDDRKQPVFGVVLHTTGSGVPDKAAKMKIDPLEYAVAYYTDPDTAYFPHYVIGYDGTIFQVANEKEKAKHVGLIGPKGESRREQYLSGEWKKLLPAPVVALWQARWPKYASPSHLYPGPSVNDVYIGVEMIPISGAGAQPAGPGLKFTAEQHQAAAELSADVAKRYGFPAGWASGPRLVGHEDVGLIDRCDKAGGWDPGALRANPYFDMDRVRRAAEPQTLLAAVAALTDDIINSG